MGSGLPRFTVRVNLGRTFCAKEECGKALLKKNHEEELRKCHRQTRRLIGFKLSFLFPPNVILFQKYSLNTRYRYLDYVRIAMLVYDVEGVYLKYFNIIMSISIFERYYSYMSQDCEIMSVYSWFFHSSGHFMECSCGILWARAYCAAIIAE